MLAIRLQRVGRKGHPVYRIAVQEAWRTPSSGRVIAYVGSYDPHTKEATIQNETAQKYLDNGAQPTPRVVKLLKDAGVKLPKWVEDTKADKQKSIKNAEKLRKNQPKEKKVEKAEEVKEAPAGEATEEASSVPEETPTEEAPKETEEAEKSEETEEKA